MLNGLQGSRLSITTETRACSRPIDASRGARSTRSGNECATREMPRRGGSWPRAADHHRNGLLPPPLSTAPTPLVPAPVPQAVTRTGLPATFAPRSSRRAVGSAQIQRLITALNKDPLEGLRDDLTPHPAFKHAIDVLCHAGVCSCALPPGRSLRWTERSLSRSAAVLQVLPRGRAEARKSRSDEKPESRGAGTTSCP